MATQLPSFLFGGSARDARSSGARGGRGAGRRENAEKSLFGVPERFMKPRLVLIAVTAILVCFGLLMIYSASSVTCLASKACNYDAAYYLKRQLGFAAIGVILAVVIAKVDYHALSRDHLVAVIAVVILALALVFVPGFSNSTYGASRWIKLGPLQLQPSEFAKVAIVIVAASLAQSWFVDGDMSNGELLKFAAAGIGVPIALIVIQPDKGTTVIIALTIAIMLLVAGFDLRKIAVPLGLVAVLIIVYSLTQDYALSRIQTFLNPWEDEQGDSYQIIQGFYAFGSGGLFGVGIGFSKQKYAYLPMAHNDFIFAVVGEECGLVGTLGVIAGFAVFAWAGFRIAKYASDLSGRLIACGCTSLIIIQLFVNVCGVLKIIPLSGKPLPFLSYGGSSIMACLMFVGMLVSVSKHSSLPETDHDRRRRGMRRYSGAEEGDPGLSFVGEPTPRSERGRGWYGGVGSAGAERGFTVVGGGRAQGAASRVGAGARPRPRGDRGRDAGTRRPSGGYERINLNDDPGARLRNDRGRDRGPRRR